MFSQQHKAWSISVYVLALILAIPSLTIAAYVFYPASDIWGHLFDTVLADYVSNSLILMVGVGTGTLLIGVPSAWLIANTSFPGRSFFQWALLLPMAMPAYIIAYTYTGMLDYGGAVQQGIRSVFDVSYGEYWFPSIHSLGGAICMLSLVLYPYVYLLARAAFLNEPRSFVEVSRTLGQPPWKVFFTITLPIARPAIFTGLSLVLMETLADFGTVQYFGIDTFTTGIYRTWFGFGDSAAAAQLSACLMAFIFLLMSLERYGRKQSRFHHNDAGVYSVHLGGWKAAAAVMACGVPLCFGFILPTLQLAKWAISVSGEVVDLEFLQLCINSFVLALSAALIALFVATFIAYAKRFMQLPSLHFITRLAILGYAMPGTVLAVGIMIPLAWFDNSLDAWMSEHWGVSTGLLLSGSLFALLFAYTVRFLAASLQTVESGLEKIKPTIDDAARTLGASRIQLLTRVHFPLMKGSLLTAALMVFVDVLKELPATLILRPFNFNTLAVRAYELASDESLIDASVSAITIVLVGLIPIYLLSKSIQRSNDFQVDNIQVNHKQGPEQARPITGDT